MEVFLAVILIIILVAIVRTLQEQAATNKRKQPKETVAFEKPEAEGSQAAARQGDYAESLVRNCKESLGDFELLPGHLIAAEESLDQADARFCEGAFAAFWDSIERAVQELGAFDTRVRTLNGRFTTYNTLVKQYEGQPPQFPIGHDCVCGLAVSARTAERLRSVVYNAHGKSQFVEIYEQRKSNPFLVAGFATFANALALMSSELQSSIGQLASSAGKIRLPPNDSLQRTQTNVANAFSLSTQRPKDVILELKSAATERKALALELLENWEQNARRQFP